jgi:hypothetical protein
LGAVVQPAAAVDIATSEMTRMSERLRLPSFARGDQGAGVLDTSHAAT